MLDVVDTEKAVQMYLDGRKVAAILEETGIPRSSLYAALDQAGVLTRQPRRQRLGAQPPPHADAEMLQWATDRIAFLEAELAKAQQTIATIRFLVSE